MKPRVLYLLLLFTSLLLPFVSANPASGSYDCAAHDPTLTQNQGRGCLANLEGNEDLYEECRDPEKTTTCFLFLEDPPFVTFWKPDKWNVADGDFRLQTPFRCGDFENAFRDQGGIDGIAMRLHNMTSSGNDLCIWAGDFSDCSFNQLVDYTQIMAEQDYRFAVSGVLLELPSRQCRHEPSAPFVDNEMIVIGLTPKEIANNKGALHQLTRPFHWGAWAIFLGTMLLFMLVCVIIAIRIHVFRGRSLVTAFFIFVGARDHAIAHETEVTGDESNPTKLSSFAVKYGLATTMYRIALVSFVGIFLLFYEVAVVNFLFQQQDLSLAKSVKSLTVQELQQYAVTKNSAVESVWNATVVTGRRERWDDDDIPWFRCSTPTECLENAAKEKEGVRFVVTFETIGNYLLRSQEICDTLTIFETKDILYHFNGGWLYNEKVDPSRRLQTDREIIGLRIAGTLRKILEEQVVDFSCESEIKPYIGTMIILIPILVFVIPSLVSSVLVLFLWKKRSKKTRPDEGILGASSSSAQTLPKDEKSSSSS